MNKWLILSIILFIVGLITLIVFFSMSSINNTDSHYGLWKTDKINDENKKT